MNQFVSTCSSIKQIATLKNNTWHTYSSIDFEMYVLYDAFSISFSNFLVFHLWALCLIQLHACSLKLCSWISGFRKVQQICTPIHNLLTFFLFSNQKIYRVTKIVYTTKDAITFKSIKSTSGTKFKFFSLLKSEKLHWIQFIREHTLMRDNTRPVFYKNVYVLNNKR